MSEGWVILGAMKKPSGQQSAQFRKQQQVENIDALELSPAQQQIADLGLQSIALIVGLPGSGKTTALRAMLARPKRKRTIIWSPKEAMDNYAGLYPGDRKSVV